MPVKVNDRVFWTGHTFKPGDLRSAIITEIFCRAGGGLEAVVRADDGNTTTFALDAKGEIPADSKWRYDEAEARAEAGPPITPAAFPYRLATDRGQEIDLFLDEPMPVEFVVGLTRELDQLLRQRPDIKKVTMRLACER